MAISHLIGDSNWPVMALLFSRLATGRCVESRTSRQAKRGFRHSARNSVSKGKNDDPTFDRRGFDRFRCGGARLEKW